MLVRYVVLPALLTVAASLYLPSPLSQFGGPSPHVANREMAIHADMASASLPPSGALQHADAALGTGEVVRAVKQRGFSDVELVRQRGNAFILEATGQRGERVRLVVDGATGDITGLQVIGFDGKRN